MKELLKLNDVKVLDKIAQRQIIAGKPPICDPDICDPDTGHGCC